MTTEIRVFHLIKGLGRGGAEMLLAQGLRFADRGRFTYGYGYFLPWKDAMVSSLEEQGAEVTCFRARHNIEVLLSARNVAAHLKGWNADLLHCHMPMAGAVGRVAGKLAGVPVVYTEHNKMERFHPLTRWLNLATWSLQEKVIAVSADVASSIRSYADSRVPLEVVLNGVDVQHFSRERVDPAAVREQWRIPAAAPVIGTVAVFRVQKQLQDWLQAAKLLLERHPDAHFLLVGDGPQREELVALARSLGLETRVHFPGLQPEVRPYLAAMDIYMMSSIFEGLPVAMLEAMAMRCTVVATSVGGIPEVIRASENGFLVEPERPDLLVQVADALLSSPEVMRRVGAVGRRTVEERFGMHRMARELENLYFEVLKARRNGN